MKATSPATSVLDEVTGYVPNRPLLVWLRHVEGGAVGANVAKLLTLEHDRGGAAGGCSGAMPATWMIIALLTADSLGL